VSEAAPPARAELIEDGGAAAASAEFFRSPQFLAAEGATHTLRIETADGAELLAPLVVRTIGEGPERDATSPYGFPGFAAPPRLVVDPAEVDFAAAGLVSAFFRHRLGEPPLAGATPRNVVQVADPALPRKSRPSDRRQIRRNRERGYALELVPGGEASAAQRAGFVDLYEQTMRRTEAARRYFFDPSYFDLVLAAERTWLVLASDPNGELAAASIAAVSDGYLHYYLSGSADTRLADSPMKNVVALLVDHAERLGMPLNLGGGIDPGDALEEFKRGFANREEQWRTSEVVCDPVAYARLTDGREGGGYFPAYRAG
jgi:GNAT acetyltransferase-like protein